jgi:phage tail sheath gpL-like
VTIDETTYKFVSALAAANDVLIGAAKEKSAANLVAAINGAAGEGTLYGTGTVANEAVTATVAEAVVTVTAAEAGTAGNSIVLTESSTAITASGSGTLAGGVDAQ